MYKTQQQTFLTSVDIRACDALEIPFVSSLLPHAT